MHWTDNKQTFQLSTSSLHRRETVWIRAYNFASKGASLGRCL